MSETTRSLMNRVRDEEAARIVEIVAAHADMDERGNRVLVDLIIDEIGGGSETRVGSTQEAIAYRDQPNDVDLPLDPNREL